MQKQFQQLEEKIAVSKVKVSALEAALVDPLTYSDKTKFLEAESTYKKATEDLTRFNAEYEKVFEKIMELEQKVNG